MADDKMKGLGNEVEMMNALLGKVYSVLTTGGTAANKSADNFRVVYSWDSRKGRRLQIRRARTNGSSESSCECGYYWREQFPVFFRG